MVIFPTTRGPSASTASREIVVTPANDPARVVIPAGTTTFVESVYEPVGTVEVNPLATLVDPDTNTFSAAIVVIGEGFAPAEDVLLFSATTETGDIGGIYAPATGILSLTSAGGSATREGSSLFPVGSERFSGSAAQCEGNAPNDAFLNILCSPKLQNADSTRYFQRKCDLPRIVPSQSSGPDHLPNQLQTGPRILQVASFLPTGNSEEPARAMAASAAQRDIQ